MTYTEMKYKFPLNIQLFGDPGDPDPNKEKEKEKEKEGGQGADTFTKAEVTDMIDKAVAKTIAKERTRWEEELSKKEKEKKEEIELSKMSAEERARALYEKEKADFESERVTYQREKLHGEAKDTLSDLKLSREFAKYLLAEDKEKTLANINAFKSEFDKAVQAQVDEIFKNNGRSMDQKKYDNKGVNPFLPESFNLTEQGRLMKEDPSKAKALQEAAKNKK